MDLETIYVTLSIITFSLGAYVVGMAYVAMRKDGDG